MASEQIAIEALMLSIVGHTEQASPHFTFLFEGGEASGLRGHFAKLK